MANARPRLGIKCEGLFHYIQSISNMAGYALYAFQVILCFTVTRILARMLSMETAIYGKTKAKSGISPAIGLINPKYPHNVGAAVRAASCFGVGQVWYSGDRISLPDGKKSRLPREERMKGFKEVELRQFDYFFDEFESDVVPVAVELQPNSENLMLFEHPEKALYVFGPEDGHIGPVLKRHCHRFVVIPTRHCTNLAAAIYLILYDRMLKRCRDGVEPYLPITEILAEERGWAETEKLIVTGNQ